MTTLMRNNVFGTGDWTFTRLYNDSVATAGDVGESLPITATGFGAGYIMPSAFNTLGICDYCDETSSNNLCLNNITICGDCFKKAMDSLLGKVSITRKAIAALRGKNN